MIGYVERGPEPLSRLRTSTTTSSREATMHDGDTTVERWLPVVGYEGLYEVSDQGRIASLARFVRGKHGAPKPIRAAILSPIRKRSGYLHIGLCRYGHPKHGRIHCLVLEAFVGPRPHGCVGRHIDGDKDHNALINLAWGTNVENKADSRRHGTIARGERHGHARLTADQVRAIRESTQSARIESRLHGVHQGTIYMIRARTTWAWLKEVA